MQKMTSPLIYSALNLPTVTTHPSADCLQWSSEGQLCFGTKNVAYILTPEYGITFDTTSVVKGIIPKGSTDKSPPQVGWFRTIVQFDANEPIKWPEHSQDWGTVSLGSLDMSLCAIAWSPSNLLTKSGCILATLSSNMDLCLWKAARNPLKGEWVKVFSATPSLVAKLASTSPQLPKAAQCLKAQITSICWTSATDFGLRPAPRKDGSFLIAGTRSGSVLLLRYREESLELVHDIALSKQWITHVAFCYWKTEQPGICTGVFAYGSATGAVGLVQVSEKLVEEANDVLLNPNYTLNLDVKDLGLIHQSDKAGITSLQWIFPPMREPILAFSKPGRVHLWSPGESSVWSGERTFRLKTQKVHKSSSSLQPITGVNYMKSKDLLVLTLSDGSVYAIEHLSTEPTLQADGEINPLSKTARSVFIKTEQDDVDVMDANRITGSVTFGDSFTLVWAHETARPSDFSYKHDAKNSTTLIVAQVLETVENANDLLIEDLGNLLKSVKIAHARGPLDLLRPYLFHLSDPDKLNELHSRILQTLNVPEGDHTLSINIPPCVVPLSDEVRKKFRESLTRHLFGYDELLALRMRLSCADFTWKLSSNSEKRQEVGKVAQHLLNAISHRSTRTILRHLVAGAKLVQPNDVPFIMRMVIQSLLPGSPKDLGKEAQAMATLMQEQAQVTLQTADEHCPACGVIVPLKDITTAVCSNGHSWTRCSVTTFILSTPSVRSCIGCSRKAFLPLSERESLDNPSWLPSVASGWVVEELLEAVEMCLYCNNGFVRVL